jgi:hypothetical protein
MGLPREIGERLGKVRVGHGLALRNAVRRVTFVIRPASGA